ncbi:MAG: beta-ketoacyl synthase N-terminal-like domain-containing protein, partial [Isosphaeraceae bacterium]|nr:beta-ketoacyl synthase N-terminal-like domain-containing protein [Isosphaeraceae bacterium]
MSKSQTNGCAHVSHGPADAVREPIAVVGIGCRFPGRASDPAAFWSLLESGTDAITEVPPERWSLQAFYDPDPAKPGKSYSRWGGFVEGIDRFDPHPFGISLREAARMDPQQRLLLEVAWEGLEDGGLTQSQLAGTKTAVFVGISSFDYSVLETSFRDRGGIDVYSNTGGSLSIAANRISYCFDLRGPSAAVDTACSSALVAVHLACESLWRDDCTLALAGGVNALLLPDWYVGFCRMGMLSPEGRCRAFDARASGFVRSEGAGMVVLKPLSRALADNDRIYAVIRGTALNQDGRTAGMTVPSELAQEALIRQACRSAGIAPAQVQYVEAHGTGTPVGDPIEARALGRALGDGRPEGKPCLVGSVKTNIGHLEAGAGIAGLIKVALALHHRRVPGNLHFDRPNPDIDFEGLHLRVPTRCEPWPDGRGPATAGVNAFGFGGTNAHIILQEVPRESPMPLVARPPQPGPLPRGGGTGERPPLPDDPPQDRGPARRAMLLPLSARGPEALRAAARSFDEFLVNRPEGVALDDVAASAALRRTHHDHRLAIVAHSEQELSMALREFAAGNTPAGTVEGRASGSKPRLAFVCSGQGPQWWAMGRELLREEPVFRDTVARCDAVVRRLGPWTLLDALTADEAASRMNVTAIAQPCLFAIQVALAALWDSWGVQPEAVLGHSVGEVAAAYLAGVFDLDDAVRVIYHRGRCMEQAPARGRMLAAAIAPGDALARISGYGDRVALAAINSPQSVTLSGDAGPLEEIAAGLDASGVFHRFLKVQYAFHSAQMDPIRDELLRALQGIRPRRARLPLFSTVTGRRVEGLELGPEYWWQNIRQAVRFADGMERLIERDIDTLVELSPHPVLAASIIECFQHRGRKAAVLPSLRRHEPERGTLLHSLGVLHTRGYPVRWEGVASVPRRFVRLPLYSWQRERCWHESEDSRVSRLTPPSHPLLGVPRGEPSPAWEARLDLRSSAYLSDHRVRQGVILPATAYLELAFAAAREAYGEVGCSLREVVLANPCFLTPDEPLWVHSTFDPQAGTFQVHTRPVEGAREWTAHLSAVVRPCVPPVAVGGEKSGEERTDDGGAPSPLDAIRRRCPREYSRERCYAYLRSIGLDYGPLFQGIETVWQGDRESLGFIRLPDALVSDEDSFRIHPALFDACLQVVITADDDFDQRNGGLYLPSTVEQVQLLRRPGRHVWAHAQLREKTPRRSLADVDVYDDQGQLVARVRGLESRRVAGGRTESLEDLLYAYQWQPLNISEPIATTETGHWLIFADTHGLGAALAEHLQTRGDSCTLAFAGPTDENLGPDRPQIDPTRPDDLLRLVRTVTSSRPCRGVIYLWNLDAPATDGLTTPALASAQQAGALGVVHLVQAWDKGAGDQSAPLFLVTRGAQTVGDRPEPVAVAQAPAIGLGRVIAGEYPRLACKLVDLDPHAPDGGLESLVQEIQARDDEDEVAWRGSERFVHRYLPAPGLPKASAARTGIPYRLAITSPGTLDNLCAQALRRRPPGPGEVEIEVFAAGLNFSDVMKALGLYPGLPDGPVPLGAECSGRVSAVGEGVNNVRPGDEVLAVAGFAFGSHVLTKADLVALKPPQMGFEEAAGLPIAYLTAAYALEHLARLGPGETVLVHSASGGVGLAAIQIARRAGATVFATAGSPEKRAFLRALG